MPVPNYNSWIQSQGEITAGSDALVVFEIFSAAEKPVRVEQMHYFGGDAGEFMQLFLIPPNVLKDGVSVTQNLIPAGAIAITSKEFAGGAYGTDAQPGTWSADNGGRGTGRWSVFTIPAGFVIGAATNGSPSTAWNISIGGFEIDA